MFFLLWFVVAYLAFEVQDDQHQGTSDELQLRYSPYGELFLERNSSLSISHQFNFVLTNENLHYYYFYKGLGEVVALK